MSHNLFQENYEIKTARINSLFNLYKHKMDWIKELTNQFEVKLFWLK